MTRFWIHEIHATRSTPLRLAPPDILVDGEVAERIQEAYGHVQTVHGGPGDDVFGRCRRLVPVRCIDLLELRPDAVVGDLETPQFYSFVHTIVPRTYGRMGGIICTPSYSAVIQT